MTPHAYRCALVLLSLALASCASSPPRLSGDTVRLTLAQQVLDPGALRNAGSVAGIDGPAAREALLRYQRSFQEPAPAAATLLGGAAK